MIIKNNSFYIELLSNFIIEHWESLLNNYLSEGIGMGYWGVSTVSIEFFLRTADTIS